MAFFERLWSDVSRRLKKSKRTLLILDFDGTLSPTVSPPARAKLGEGIKPLLKKIQSSPSIHLVILSGRPISILSKNIGLKRVVYGGVHGFELEGPRLSFHPAQARRIFSRMRFFQREINREVGRIRGVGIEKKGFSIAVHYRNLRPYLLRHFH